MEDNLTLEQEEEVHENPVAFQFNNPHVSTAITLLGAALMIAMLIFGEMPA